MEKDTAKELRNDQRDNQCRQQSNADKAEQECRGRVRHRITVTGCSIKVVHVSFAANRSTDLLIRLMQQVPRMLFPPSTNENDFDYEATLDRTSYLEDQLTANQQSIHLLRAQIGKEEKLLKADEEEAVRLDQAFKSNTAFRRQQSKSLHPISKTIAGGLDDEQHKQRALASGKVDSQTNESSWAQDRDLQAILRQLRSHLGSMSNNISDVRQLDAEMQALHQDLSVFWHSRSVL